MASRFVDGGSVDDFISEQQNKSRAQKTQRDFTSKLLQKDIPIEELNKCVSNFIIWVRTKDGKQYKPSSFRKFTSKLRATSQEGQ